MFECRHPNKPFGLRSQEPRQGLVARARSNIVAARFIARALCLLFVLSSCSTPAPPSPRAEAPATRTAVVEPPPPPPPDSAEPEEAFETAVAAVKAADYDTAFQYFKPEAREALDAAAEKWSATPGDVRQKIAATLAIDLAALPQTVDGPGLVALTQQIYRRAVADSKLLRAWEKEKVPRPDWWNLEIKEVKLIGDEAWVTVEPGLAVYPASRTPQGWRIEFPPPALPPVNKLPAPPKPEKPAEVKKGKSRKK